MKINFVGVYAIRQKSVIRQMLKPFGVKENQIMFSREIIHDDDVVNAVSEKDDMAPYKKRRKIADVLGRFFEPNVFIINHIREVYNNVDVFRSLADQLGLIALYMKGEWRVPVPPYEDYIVGDIEAVLNMYHKSKLISVDIETIGLNARNDELISIGISDAPGNGGAFPFINHPEFIGMLNEFFRNKECIFHHGQYDVPWLSLHGINLNYRYDTMFMSYIRDERKGVHGLKHLAYVDLGDYGIDVKKMKEAWESDKEKVLLYNAADCDATFRVFNRLKKILTLTEMKIHDDIMLSGAKLFIDMWIKGLKVSKDGLAHVKEIWEGKINECDEILKKYCDEGVNFNSVPQVKKILYKDLKLVKMSNKNGKMSQKLIQRKIDEVMPEASHDAINCWKSTSTQTTSNMKSDSTSLFMLYWLGIQHEFPATLANRRLVAKRMGAYHDGIIKRLWDDSFLSPDFKMIGTRTGRLSSGNPNIHGIPKDKVIKNIFEARKGYTIIAADYSQAEVRMLAHLSGDAGLRKACVEGDIHYNNMKKMFGFTDESVEDLSGEELKFYRRAAKTITFGIIYGREAEGLALQLQISLQEAQGLIDKFFNAYPRVRLFIDRMKKFTWDNYYSLSIYGRKRRYPFVKDRYHREKIGRQAVNMPIQSSVSDMCLLAYIRIYNIIRGFGFTIYPGPHIHDGFWYEVPDDKVEPCVAITADEMMNNIGFETKVFFKADIEVGKSWGKLETVKM